VPEKTIKSIVGKLIHIRPLVTAGKFNFDYIMRLLADSNHMDHVAITRQARQQLEFWIQLLLTCSGRTSIPFPYYGPPAWALNAYTDAAGGSSENPASGTAGVMGSWWYWLPWPKRIQHGSLKHEGKKVGRKLSALELIGPLVIIAANFAACRYRQVVVWVDNAGSVAIWQKGYSNQCSLCTTIVKATSQLAAAAGCELFIKKITRRSDDGSKIADSLSKGLFTQARIEACTRGTALDTEPGKIPTRLIQWIDHPVCDDQLANRILHELSQSHRLLRYA